MMPQSRPVTITTVKGTLFEERNDAVATEEPLEIWLGTVLQPAISLAITMRTPGQDRELAAGFLWGEGIVSDPQQIVRVVSDGAIRPGGFTNRVSVTVQGDALPELGTSRQFYMTSSCGVCGKASLEAIESQRQFDLSPGMPTWSPEVIHTLADTLRSAQETFEQTGGLHAAGLFDSTGNLQAIREDVGRHNAVDKIIGTAVLARTLPLENSILLVSGRASFELVQKTVMAGIPALAAVGAPSSLAVALAKETGLTLLGFVRGNRFNVYSGGRRVDFTGSVS